METNRITIPNFRRVAGKTADGRNIRNHMLYRSGAPIPITVQDINGMRECGIRHIVDLRRMRSAVPMPISLAMRLYHIICLR
ncbi:MAG: tyrosine-protein phosphatase [Clostridium sp.]